jgi:uncharacterized protein (TIGR03905 family)
MMFDIDENTDTVQNLEVIGGCNGNLKGIGALLKGMKVEDVISRLDGITCGIKPTSCPDQIAKALSAYEAQH